MEIDEVNRVVRDQAFEYAKEGPGYAQESVVLRRVREQLKPQSIEEQQMILESWQELFSSRTLAWGYDLDNPSRPFYHIAVVNNLAIPNGSSAHATVQ